MLWHEFIAGTGCRDTEHNHGIYKDLEIMYMNSDMSKEKIYEYGRKLVDNSLTESEQEHNAGIMSQIEDMKNEIKGLKESAASDAAYAKHQGPEWAAYYKASAKEKRKAAKALRDQVKMYQALIITPDTNTTEPAF